MTSFAAGFLLAGWLAVAACALLWSARRPRWLARLWPAAAGATVGAIAGALAIQALFAQMAGVSLDQAMDVSASPPLRTLIFTAWTATRLLGPALLPALGWLIGLVAGLWWGARRQRAQASAL